MTWNVAPYLGVPYIPNGRSYKGWDCWGLVLAVYRREFGLELNLWASLDSLDLAATSAVIAQESADWIAVEQAAAQPFDIALMTENGRPVHCGVIVSPPQFLHCARGFGTVVASYTDRGQIWRKRLVGFFRHPRLADPDFRPTQAVRSRPHHP